MAGVVWFSVIGSKLVVRLVPWSNRAVRFEEAHVHRFPFASRGTGGKEDHHGSVLVFFERRKQRMSNTAMASAVDLGIASDPRDSHPPDKLDVAPRLVLAARHVAYGESIVFCGPLYQSRKVEGKNVRLRFTHCGSGLTLGISPYNPTGQPVRRRPN